MLKKIFNPIINDQTFYFLIIHNTKFFQSLNTIINGLMTIVGANVDEHWKLIHQGSRICIKIYP